MLRAPKTVLDSVFNADSIFDIFKIVKISYFFKIQFCEIIYIYIYNHTNSLPICREGKRNQLITSKYYTLHGKQL